MQSSLHSSIEFFRRLLSIHKVSIAAPKEATLLPELVADVDQPTPQRKSNKKKQARRNGRQPLEYQRVEDNDSVTLGITSDDESVDGFIINGVGHMTQRRRRPFNSILTEPAFRSEMEYPSGWMVFHPVLGVVTKEKADRHQKEGPNQGNHQIALKNHTGKE